ncbi:MAG: hypothetical protein BHV88_16390 [Clostridiales bacterium 41_12_two_minus]|jgi:hypothetical protein|nr:MAG: hypothetical protein BHV88_16390 [Clostridiales bacterium 41_12_two_minus]DAM48158.1 MAG TPA: hypothetical protein [Caudoviricetes sp.]
MMESEAINVLNMIEAHGDLAIKAKQTAINALEEVQQYRAIGTLEELKEAMKYVWLVKKHGTIGKALEECAEYESIGTPEECRAAVEKQKIDKELESHDEKHILKYCINLMQELVGKFEEWYEYVHGEDAIKELCEDEKFCYRMTYSNIVQELFLFGTSHSGGTSTRAKCKQLGVDSSDEIEFSFGDDEE